MEHYKPYKDQSAWELYVMGYRQVSRKYRIIERMINPIAWDTRRGGRFTDDRMIVPEKIMMEIREIDNIPIIRWYLQARKRFPFQKGDKE